MQEELTKQTSRFIDLPARNLKISPGDDFFEHAFGTWLQNTLIPDEYSRWGSFDILHHENYDRLKVLLEDEEYFLNHPKSSLAIRLKKFFVSGLDEEAIERVGVTPLQTDLDLIESLDNLGNLAKVVSHLHSYSSTPLFNIFPEPDYKNSSFMLAFLMQGGLGLPDRDYYLKNDEKFLATKEKYLAHIQRMFELAHWERQEKVSERIWKIETALAEYSSPREDLRDSEKNYHKMTINELSTLAPNLNWQEYFQNMGLTDLKELNIGQPEFFNKLSLALEQFALDDWKLYLKWHLLLDNAKYLSKPLVEENFSFYGQHLNGLKVLKSRYKRVIDHLDGLVGEAVGELYVARYFPMEYRLEMDALVKNLRLAIEKRLDNLTWMSRETKEAAQKKLKTLRVKIGYPDVFPDFSAWQVTSDVYYENLRSARYFEWQRQLNKINKPVDLNEWLMHAHEVNAYFSRERNEIVFPAGILQPPFFHPEADRAVNYGAIGSVIGHEIIHAFDDQGRKFDEHGHLRDWWAKEDEEKFNVLAKRLVEQYDNYYPFPDAHINGEFTLGENIADLGGVVVSFEALKLALQEKPEGRIDNLTPEQRFFYSFAASEKGKTREEKGRLALIIDPHSPSKYRVNGVVTNLTEFYDAFNVKEGEGLYQPAEKRIQIW